MLMSRPRPIEVLKHIFMLKFAIKISPSIIFVFLSKYYIIEINFFYKSIEHKIINFPIMKNQFFVFLIQ